MTEITFFFHFNEITVGKIVYYKKTKHDQGTSEITKSEQDEAKKMFKEIKRKNSLDNFS